ncbi:thrombospondin type 3 repeat-containing protein [Aggregatilineales bacterium SYSU G02658]
MIGSNRTVLRGVLLLIILGTMPFYVLGIGIWATAPDRSAQQRFTQTATAQGGSSSVSPTWTPLGMNRATSTPLGFPTAFATFTPLSPLLPTPGQFLPIRTPVPTLFIPPSDTPAPTLTPILDRDGDGVPDHLDMCPNAPGPASNQGCPLPTATAIPILDSDGDGIPDTIDQCPSQPGPASNQGCPLPADRDGDGIIDTQDLCPDVPGLPQFQGCPPPTNTPPPPTTAPSDRDGDGIPDDQDACPDQWGTPLTMGCPEPTASP